MNTWFSDTVKKHQDSEQEPVGDETERSRDQFREKFELAFRDVILPKFEDVVDSARKHNFPAEVSKERDSRNRLRAIQIAMLAKPGARISESVYGVCVYKIAVQMRTQRLGHMMFVENLPQIAGHNHFGGLESVNSDTIDVRLQQFVEFALQNKDISNDLL